LQREFWERANDGSHVWHPEAPDKRYRRVRDVNGTDTQYRGWFNLWAHDVYELPKPKSITEVRRNTPVKNVKVVPDPAAVKNRLDGVKDMLEVNPEYEVTELREELDDREEDRKLLKDVGGDLESKATDKNYDLAAVRKARARHAEHVREFDVMCNALRAAGVALESRPRPEEGRKKFDWDNYVKRYNALRDRVERGDEQWLDIDYQSADLKDAIDIWRSGWWDKFVQQRDSSRRNEAKVDSYLSELRLHGIVIPLRVKTSSSVATTITPPKRATTSANLPPSFHPDRPGTWGKCNPIEFANDVTRETINGAIGGSGLLSRIESAAIRPHGASGRNADPRVGVPFHTHLAGGSWGLAFVYVRENNDTVTPCVYDIAYSRHANQYNWENGGRGYNSDAARC